MWLPLREAMAGAAMTNVSSLQLIGWVPDLSQVSYLSRKIASAERLAYFGATACTEAAGLP